MAEMKLEDGKKERYYLYYDGESVSGKVSINYLIQFFIYYSNKQCQILVNSIFMKHVNSLLFLTFVILQMTSVFAEYQNCFVFKDINLKLSILLLNIVINI